MLYCSTSESDFCIYIHVRNTANRLHGLPWKQLIIEVTASLFFLQYGFLCIAKILGVLANQVKASYVSEF